jgi:hypothetical protein
MQFEDTVIYQGDIWTRLDTLPRFIAEGWRYTLSSGGIVSAICTPFQWLMSGSVIEIQAGGYMGDVGLYVPKVQLAEALELLGDNTAGPI